MSYCQFLKIQVFFVSGVMKLEATKFRPREVVKHVLQTAAASLKKMLTLEGYIADDVPLEVSALQILTLLLESKSYLRSEDHLYV